MLVLTNLGLLLVGDFGLIWGISLVQLIVMVLSMKVKGAWVFILMSEVGVLLLVSGMVMGESSLFFLGLLMELGLSFLVPFYFFPVLKSMNEPSLVFLITLYKFGFSVFLLLMSGFSVIFFYVIVLFVQVVLMLTTYEASILFLSNSMVNLFMFAVLASFSKTLSVMLLSLYVLHSVFILSISESSQTFFMKEFLGWAPLQVSLALKMLLVSVGPGVSLLMFLVLVGVLLSVLGSLVYLKSISEEVESLGGSFIFYSFVVLGVILFF